MFESRSITNSNSAAMTRKELLRFNALYRVLARILRRTKSFFIKKLGTNTRAVSYRRELIYALTKGRFFANEYRARAGRQRLILCYFSRNQLKIDPTKKLTTDYEIVAGRSFIRMLPFRLLVFANFRLFWENTWAGTRTSYAMHDWWIFGFSSAPRFRWYLKQEFSSNKSSC